MLGARIKIIWEEQLVDKVPHNLYSGAKHIPLFSQRPFHFHCSMGAFLMRPGKFNNIPPPPAYIDTSLRGVFVDAGLGYAKIEQARITLQEMAVFNS